jgi:hypothetical protein
MHRRPLPNYQERLVMVSWQDVSPHECQQRALAAVSPIMCKDAAKPHTEWTYWDPHTRDHFADHLGRFNHFCALQIDLLRPSFDYLQLRDGDRLAETIDELDDRILSIIGPSCTWLFAAMSTTNDHPLSGARRTLIMLDSDRDGRDRDNSPGFATLPRDTLLEIEHNLEDYILSRLS